MSSSLISVIPQTRYDFTFLAQSATKTIVVQRAMPVVPFYYGTLLVRVHELDLGANASIKLEALTTDPSSSDPQEFTVSTASGLTITIDDSNSAGDLEIDIDSPLGPYLKFSIIGTQSPSAPVNVWAEISADFIGRGA